MLDTWLMKMSHNYLSLYVNQVIIFIQAFSKINDAVKMILNDFGVWSASCSPSR